MASLQGAATRTLAQALLGYTVSMIELADFIARHALWVLLALVFVLLIATALFSHLIHTYGDRVERFAVRLWNALRASSPFQAIKRVPIVGPLLTRTMTVVRYFGLYAVLGFIVALGAFSLFFEIADEIGIDESLAEFDGALAAALSRHLSLETLRVFAAITTLGDRDFLIVLASVVAAALLWLRRWALAGAWIIATGGGGLLNLALKGLFERPRPPHEHGLVTETSWSFPSGHASGSMLIYGLLGYLILRHTPRAWHIPVAVVTVALIVFVGSSRVLLQVHYFSDVLAGYASAGAWVAVCIAGLEAVRWREAKRIPGHIPGSKGA